MGKLIERIEKKKQDLYQDIRNADFGYEYPRGLDLRPGSELHDLIVEHIIERVTIARKFADNVKLQWQKLDWTLNSYVPLDDVEAATKAADTRKPVHIVVPMTFSMREVYLTYLTAAFLSKPVLHKMRGMGSKRALVQGAVMERVVARQSLWFKEPMKYQTQWADALTYGFGVVSPQWRKTKGPSMVDTEVNGLLAEVLSDVLDVSEGDVLRYIDETTLFEGTELQNIDPYQFFYDPNVTPSEIQKAGYLGWVHRDDTALDLLQRETDPEEHLFNGKYARMAAQKGQGKSQFWNRDESGRDTTTSLSTDFNANLQDTGAETLDTIPYFTTLIPSEWGLGDEDRPTKWMFQLSADRILTQCEPLHYRHGMYPVALTAPSGVGHELIPTSYLAITYGLQEFVDWHMKARADAVRKNLNDMTVLDPSKVEYDDVRHPGPGKIIRLKNTAYSQGVTIDAYIKQLQQTDVTQNHMANIGELIALGRQCNGTVDILMGDMSNLPERPTAAGVSAAQTGSLSRMQRIAKMVWFQSMRDIAFQHAFNTSQFMQSDMAVPLIGSFERQVREEYQLGEETGEMDVMVGPWDISPNVEILPHDGTLPTSADITAQTEVIKTLLGQENVQSYLMQYFGKGIIGMFTQWARKSGFEDVHEFAQANGGQMPNLQIQTMPDEQMQGQIQAGNVVSLGSAR